MNLVLTISVTQKCLAVLLFTGVAAPIAGLLFKRVGGSWDTFGKGPFAIEQQQPPAPGGSDSGGRPAPAVDPAIQAAEVRQMLEAKAERRKRRGEAPLDVEAEATRLLAPAADDAGADPGLDAKLRAEVRSLVIARNERRMRKGEQPLDVEAETEHQLADFIGLGE
jgi:hypothetical protein